MKPNEQARATLQALRQLLTRSLESWDRESDVAPAIGELRRLLSIGELETSFYAYPRVRIPPDNLSDRVFPLPPLSGEPNFIPLLSFQWDFEPSEGRPEGSFRLYMVPTEIGRRPVREGRAALHILRFDLHETDSRWGFSHVQSCDKEDVYTDWAGLDPKLVSPDVPRIPLVGITLDAPGLLLALVTGLYGVGSYEFNVFADREIMRSSGAAGRLVRDFVLAESTQRASRAGGGIGRHR